MDIAKYIGLFLVKNRYCNLPNLGDFNVVKKSASTNDGQVKAPEYEVNFVFSGGLIDDAFANFIATNERTSIANAANAVKDFSVNTKQTMADGGTVEIPGFGKFVGHNGKNEFIADTNIHVETPGIPIFKINTAATQSTIEGESIAQMHEKMQLREPTSEDDIVIKPPKVNWSKVIVLIAIILVVLAAVAAAFWYMNKQKEDNPPIEAAPAENISVPTQTEDTSTQNTNTNSTTSDANTNTAVATPTAPSTPAGSSTFGILTYKDKVAAEKKEKQLKGYGHNVALRQGADSVITLTITLPNVSNVEATKDSLRRFFNPKGEVTIMP